MKGQSVMSAGFFLMSIGKILKNGKGKTTVNHFVGSVYLSILTRQVYDFIQEITRHR